jgi:hypothetical protein
MESPTPQFTPVEQPKKSNTALIIGIVVAVLLCCCCLVIVGVVLFMGPAVGSIYSSVNQQLTALPEIPTMPDGTSEPSIPAMPTLPADVIPQGGLGDDLLRTNTWAYVIIVAATDGCSSPNAADTAITVTQKQDSAGVWKEQWLVACDGGTSVPVNVTFTPSASGGTDINVTKGE